MYRLSSFYKFFPLPKARLKADKSQLYLRAKELGLRGLFLLAEEGINGSFCGLPEKITPYKAFLSQHFKESFFWKDATCKSWSFKRLSIKIKKEIVNSGSSIPAEGAFSLSPFEWEKRLKSKDNVQLLDVRNHYETAIGKFKTAKCLDINLFQELGHRLDHLNIDKNQETLIYCTGGIRCEKVIPLMREKGFKKVFQLRGGILNYLKDFPHSQFEKECFVFDHRAAVDQNLNPSKRYSLCPHCGQAGDLEISCGHCTGKAKICKMCKHKAFYYKTCSKNCAYHFKAGHKYRGRKLQIHC